MQEQNKRKGQHEVSDFDTAIFFILQVLQFCNILLHVFLN